MEINERNALAELAKRLGEITSAWRPSEPTGQYAIQSISYVRKAQRIVAELAKVANRIIREGTTLMYTPEDRMAIISAVDNCRAIAEEGEPIVEDK